MKVLCEYCGSFIEADELMCCPNCGASIADCVRDAMEKQEAQIAAQKAEEEEKERLRLEQERDDRLLEIFAGVAGAAAGSYFGRGRSRSFISLISKLIKRFK